MIDHIQDAYKILFKVFKEKSYSTQALFKDKVSNLTSRIVLGVLEKNVYIEYVIKSLIEKEPKDNIMLILKIGTYMLSFLDNIPDYAIVNECVNFTKSLGKGGVSGFVNVILKKIATQQYSLPNPADKYYYSVTYSKPQWFIDRLIKEYGEQKAINILEDSMKIYDYEHIRFNPKKDKFLTIKSLKEQNIIKKETNVHGFVVENNETIKKLFRSGELTYQSPSSMLAVQCLNPKDGATILDLCSAPGGKSVYIAQLCPNSKIISCDLYEHRIKLITSYAHRMKVNNIESIILDATKLNIDFIEKFDYVLVDAPCTCFGTFIKHPDVFLMHNETSIDTLSKIQSTILSNALKYVKKGGSLVYSTCTLFKKENEDIVKLFLNNEYKLEKMHIDFENNGMLRILPKQEWDGFFVAKIIREG